MVNNVNNNNNNKNNNNNNNNSSSSSWNYWNLENQLFSYFLVLKRLTFRISCFLNVTKILWNDINIQVNSMGRVRIFDSDKHWKHCKYSIQNIAFLKKRLRSKKSSSLNTTTNKLSCCRLLRYTEWKMSVFGVIQSECGKIRTRSSFRIRTLLRCDKHF